MVTKKRTRYTTAQDPTTATVSPSESGSLSPTLVIVAANLPMKVGVTDTSDPAPDTVGDNLRMRRWKKSKRIRIPAYIKKQFQIKLAYSTSFGPR